MDKYKRIEELKLLILFQYSASLSFVGLMWSIIVYNKNLSDNSSLIYSLLISTVLLASIVIGFGIYLLIKRNKSIKENLNDKFSFLIEDTFKKTFFSTIFAPVLFFPAVFAAKQYKESGYTNEEIKLMTYNYISLNFNKEILTKANDSKEVKKFIKYMESLVNDGLIPRKISHEFIIQRLEANGDIESGIVYKIMEEKADEIYSYQLI